jgi:hypothetical protein
VERRAGAWVNTSKLLKKSLAAAGEDGIVAIVEGQLDFDGAVILLRIFYYLARVRRD